MPAIQQVMMALGASAPAPGPLVWFKADEDVFSDAGSTPATNGSTVQQWNDQSGNAINASQATSGSRPTYRTNQVNGLPAVDFATSKFMTFSNQTVTNFTLFVVAKQGAAAANKTIVGGVNNLTEINLRFTNYNLHNVQYGIVSFEEEPIASYIQACVRHGATVTTMRVDEVDTGAPTSGNTSLGVSVLGAWLSTGTPTEFLNGLIAEVILYASELSDSERNATESYLRTKYALPNPATVLTDPSTITGCQIWLKADSISLNDGDPVATWNDSSGNGNNATQATSGNRPTFQTNEINTSLPVVRFDGTDDWMQTPSIAIGSLAVVQKYGAAGNYANFTTPFNDRTASEGRMFLLQSGSTNIYSINNLMANRLFRNGTKTNSLAPINSYQINWGAWPANVLTDACDVARDDQNNARCFNGDVVEVIAYNVGLSPAYRVQVQNYLNTKYAIF